MTIQYKNVVPWGRSFDEYVRMFDLSEADLKLRILGCGDGPASFNVECNQRGGNVTSVDPIYRYSRAEIEKRVAETFDDVMEQTRTHQEKFIWKAIASVEELGRIRMEAMRCFLDSFEVGLLTHRYIPGELPGLSFADQTFDIALSSHFLFLYTDNLSFEFHVNAIREMLRVAYEVRIFPLLDVNAQESSYLPGILDEFQKYMPKVCKVNYEFQRNGNQMLVLQNN